MSFYWQQGLAQQDTGQQSQQQPQQGQWDFINLGGAPAPQHQWNPAAQQQQHNNYYYQSAPSQQQQPTNQQQYSTQQQQYNVPAQQQQSAEQSYQQQWATQQSQQQAQSQTQQIQHQPQLPKPKKAQQTVIEHTPLLPQAQQVQQTQQTPQAPQYQNFTPAPPVLTPSYQPVTVQPEYHEQQVQPQQPQQAQQSQLPQQYVHPQESMKEVFQPPQLHSTPAPDYYPPPSVAQLGSAPSSKEVTPEPHAASAPAPQMAQISRMAQAPIPTPPVLAPSTFTPIAPKKEEHLMVAAQAVVEEPKTKVTPTSSEDDWEKADMEVQRVDDENKHQKTAVTAEKPEESRESSSLGGSWSQQDTEPSERSSAEPVEIVEHPVKEEREEKTPRVSMSESHEPFPTNTKSSFTLHEERQETPEACHPNQSTSIVLNSTNSPLEAIATSTPKDSKSEKRSSLSSQGTIGTERKTSKRTEHKEETRPVFKKPDQLPEREEASDNNSDRSTGRHDFVRGDFRASYHECKKKYLAVCDRLKTMQSDSNHSNFRPSSKLGNPLLAAAAGISRNHPAIRRESAAARNNGRASVPLHHSQSFSENMYPDQNGGRRSRVSRLDPHRPSSRHGAGYQSVNHSFTDQQMMNQYDQHTYAQQQNYRQGRHSALAVPYDQRRHPSAYMANQYSGGYRQEPQETSSLSESEEDENVESDDEVRGYNIRAPIEEEGDTLYYCGVVHVNMDRWRRIKEKRHIPPEFYKFNPTEQAAFMFYTVVYGEPYRDVIAFHNKFNREFFSYKTAGDTHDDALYKVCCSIQEQYIERKKQKDLQLKTLFSDDTDGQSEVNSVYEESLSSCTVYNNGPLKFTCPHSFLHISTGGQIISLQPDQSISAVVFDDIKSALRDLPTLQVKDSAMTFKGPLLPHQSAPHTVRLYISKQIENIKRSAVAMENPEANDVVESLLVWQLLETMVKQQGNITGPDIAELLAKMASQPVNIEAPPQPSNITPALNQFTQFLLGGHVDEAVESAMRNGLFADALVLTRRLFPNDERKIEMIESRFLQTRSLSNPVTTLVSVAKGEAPPVLTNPSLDDHLSWRTHAAIILANWDPKGTALSTIYQLGRALAKRDYHCAADFCFLVCAVLGGTNPFEPIQTPEGEEEYRRYISLVNSDIPDNESNPKCQYGFLLTDLHATEIFDYALRLKSDRVSPLSTSVEYQTARIKYAKLLANHGFNTDAYKYCKDISNVVWNHWALFDSDDLLELCDLTESLHLAACVDPSEIQWIYGIRAAVHERMTPASHAPPAVVKQDTEEAAHNNLYQPDPEQVFEVSTEPLQSTPAPTYVPELDSTPAPSAFAPPTTHQTDPESVQYHQQPYYQEEAERVPPTPTSAVYQEPQAYQEELNSQFEAPYHSPASNEGYTTPSDFNDGPFTTSSSQPPMPSAPPAVEHFAPLTEPTYAPTQNHVPTPNQEAAAPSQNQLPEQVNKGQNQNFLQTMIQKALPGQNQMKLPEDKNPKIVWDPVQNKYVGSGVEQEPVAPPPPMAQTGPPPAQGGGLRAARGASRYAKVGLGNASSAPSQPPAGMMPLAPPTASFGFMPAPMDDDADAVDPFSGQANPTIQQPTQKPSN